MAAERPEKKEKKEKKRSEEAGVSKAKKDKKEEKEKKKKLAAAVEDKMARSAKAGKEDDSEAEVELQQRLEGLPLQRTVVSFAVPLADEKGMKKVYKTIRKGQFNPMPPFLAAKIGRGDRLDETLTASFLAGTTDTAAKNGTLKRGVKEVVKTLRKSPASAPGHSSSPGVVVIAGDISPMDVISHIPVLCEDHDAPFIFVSSRAELGASAKTKRPTSVVMVMEKHGGKKRAAAKTADNKEADDEGEAFAEAYAALVKYVQKEAGKQCFWTKGESAA